MASPHYFPTCFGNHCISPTSVRPEMVPRRQIRAKIPCIRMIRTDQGRHIPPSTRRKSLAAKESEVVVHHSRIGNSEGFHAPSMVFFQVSPQKRLFTFNKSRRGRINNGFCRGQLAWRFFDDIRIVSWRLGQRRQFHACSLGEQGAYFKLCLGRSPQLAFSTHGTWRTHWQFGAGDPKQLQYLSDGIRSKKHSYCPDG